MELNSKSESQSVNCCVVSSTKTSSTILKEAKLSLKPAVILVKDSPPRAIPQEAKLSLKPAVILVKDSPPRVTLQAVNLKDASQRKLAPLTSQTPTIQEKMKEEIKTKFEQRCAAFSSP